MLDGRVATYDLNLPLDSILAYSWMVENHPDKMSVSQSGISHGELIDAELPLERREANGIWYWACSFACGEPLLEQKRYWHKRFDALQAERYVDFGKRRGTVNTGAGAYK